MSAWLIRNNNLQGAILIFITLPLMAAGNEATTADEVTELEPVTVIGKGPKETATGPVKGYVASRSTGGSKTDTPVLEIPQTVNIITRDEIDAHVPQNISQAVAYTPGVVAETFGQLAREDIFYVRGFDSPEYLDGTRLLDFNRASLRIEPFGLERIEVLKGPASVLYGQNPPGGLVNLVSKRPTPDAQNLFELSGGSFGRVQGGLDLSGPIDSKKRFLYRLVALGRESDTQVDFSSDNRYYVAPNFTWRITDDTRFTFISHYQKDEIKGNSIQFLPVQGTLEFNPNGRIPTNRFVGEPDFDRFEREQYGVGYAFDHSFNPDWSFQQNLRYADVSVNYRGVFPDGFDPLNPGDLRTTSRFAIQDVDRAGTFTLDNQIRGHFSTAQINHKVLFGLDYRHQSANRANAFGSASDLDLYNPVYGSPVDLSPADLFVRSKLDQLGFYSQDQLRYGHWLATLGVRYDLASNSTDRDNQFSGVFTKTRQDNEAFTYRTGLSYLFDNGIAPYFSYSESFDPVADTDFSGNPFKPSTGQQYEVGIKYQPTGYNAFLTVSAFHLTQQNILTPDPVNIGFSLQTGEVRSRGIEVEGKASLANGLNLTAGYAYTNAVVTKANEDEFTPSQVGRQLTYTPRHQASVYLDYTLPAGTLAGVGIGGGARFVGSNFGDFGSRTFDDDGNPVDIPPGRAPSYTLFDAAVRYDLEKLSKTLHGTQLAVNFNNIFDREYLSTCGDGFCYYGNRRNITATVRVRW